MSLVKGPVFEPDWQRRINQKVDMLWNRVKEQAKEAGIPVPNLFRESTPKEFRKMGLFEPILDIFLEKDPADVMTKQKSFEQYADHIASKLGWRRNRKHPGRDKQRGMFSMFRQPNWSPQAKNYPVTYLRDELDRLQNHVRAQPSWQSAAFKEAVVPETESFAVAGNINGAFLMMHAATLGGRVNMPWTPMGPDGKPQELAIPYRFYERAHKEERKIMMPEGTYMTPSHFLVGSPSAGGRYDEGEGVIQQGNSAGAAGYPTTGMRNARDVTSDGQRATKGNTAKREMDALIAHVRAGQPWYGKTYDRLKQPVTMTARGDAAQELDLLIFSNALLNAGFPLCKLMTASRGIAICPNVSGQMESIVAGPFLELLRASNVQEYDLTHSRLVKTRIISFFDLMELGYNIVSGDVERWDLNELPGEIGIMAASWANLLPPGKQPLLFGAASAPALWKGSEIKRMQETIPVGESRTVSVAVPNTSGTGNHIEQVEVHHLEVDLRKMVVQAFEVVHGSGVRLWDYEVPTDMRRVPVPDGIMTHGDTDPDGKGWYINVHGCIRSGSLLTSANNSRQNGLITRASLYALKQLGPQSGLIRRRSKSVGLEVTEVSGDPSDSEHFFRGDDSLLATRMRAKAKILGDNVARRELDPAELFSVLMALVGRYANASKQVVGTLMDPLMEFASVLYANEAPGGLTKLLRTLLRYIAIEGSTGVFELRPMDDEESELDLGLVSDTTSAKARLMPQRGNRIPTSPFGSPTPGNEEVIRTVAGWDKYNLVYGVVDDEVMARKLIRAEARRWAAREGRKHGLNAGTLEELETEYLEAEIHQLLIAFARERAGKRNENYVKDGARISFENMVDNVSKGEYDYLY